MILWYCNFKQPAGALHCRLLLKLPRRRIDWIFYILRLLAVERSNPPIKPYAFNFMWAPTSTIPLQPLQSVRVLPGQWVSSSHELFVANSFRELSEGISNPSFTVIWRQSKYIFRCANMCIGVRCWRGRKSKVWNVYITSYVFLLSLCVDWSKIKLTLCKCTYMQILNFTHACAHTSRTLCMDAHVLQNL